MLDNTVLFFSIAFYCFYLLLILIYRRFVYTNWINTHAYIQSLYIEAEEEGTELHTLIIKKYIHISYAYKVDGAEYISKKIGVFDGFITIGNYDYDIYQSLLNSYKNNKKINVFYNPQKHAESCINRDFYSSRLVYILLSFLSLVALFLYSYSKNNPLNFDMVSILSLLILVALIVVERWKVFKRKN